MPCLPAAMPVATGEVPPPLTRSTMRSESVALAQRFWRVGAVVEFSHGFTVLDNKLDIFKNV